MSQKVKILLVGIPVLCLLLAIALPSFISPRMVRSQNSCVNVLRQIEGAKDQWITERHKTTNDTPTWADLRPYFKDAVPLQCPNGGTYIIGRCDELPTCSIARDTEYWRTNQPAVLKVSVLHSGKLLADGAEIRLDELDARLSQIKTRNGVVWYYREGAQGEPPPIAMEVMKLLVKHSLPISLSSKPDFSDTVDEQGNSRPRK
jgi:hypothetical protein